jgi:hypothetical protein
MGMLYQPNNSTLPLPTSKSLSSSSTPTAAATIPLVPAATSTTPIAATNKVGSANTNIILFPDNVNQDDSHSNNIQPAQPQLKSQLYVSKPKVSNNISSVKEEDIITQNLTISDMPRTKTEELTKPKGLSLNNNRSSSTKISSTAVRIPEARDISSFLCKRLLLGPLVPKLLVSEAGTPSSTLLTNHLMEDCSNDSITWKELELFIAELVLNAL